MYNIEQLENLLKCTYPFQVSHETQSRRYANIQAVQKLVSEAIKDNALCYQYNEERLHIFTTQVGEKIYIQYPGKESVQTGDKLRPYDFRPKIMTSTGVILRDLVFADMWGLIEDLNLQHHRMLKLMAAIFFQLGRMTLHSEVEKDYICERLDADGKVIETYSRHIHWFEFGFNEKVIQSLNFHAEALVINEEVSISLEAFLYFFELVLQNEDSKYYDKKGNLTSGRIPTSDSMLLLSSVLFGRIKLSVLLQRFVSGFGVAHCGVGEIESATDGLVHIVDRKRELTSYFKKHGIAYRESCYISVCGSKYFVALKTNTPKIAILPFQSQEAESALVSAGWNVFDIVSLTEDTEYGVLLTLYEES